MLNFNKFYLKIFVEKQRILLQFVIQTDENVIRFLYMSN